jgi:hypothetical protein
MEKRNIIKWSEYSGYTELTIPSGEIWMSECELVVMLLAFRLNSYQARAVRKE